MSAKTYSTIVFDLGNVLIPFDYNRIVVNLNKISKGLGDVMMQKFTEHHDIRMAYEAGKLSDDEFLNIVDDWLEQKISRDEFCRIFSDIFSFNERLIQLLPSFKPNYKLVLLSNTNNIHKTYAWGKYSFLQYFDKLILSHEIGAVKPEPKIYEAVMNYTQEPASTHIFIDDILEYVDGAKMMGWDSVQFTGYDKLISDFKERKIL